jgi:copper chaperone
MPDYDLKSSKIMQTLKFKTSIKCEGCVETISPRLNSLKGIVSWQVDLEDPERILEVLTDTATEEEIIAAVRENGYKIEKK